jgi:tetratricopeptide (TPR) repeat protein
VDEYERALMNLRSLAFLAVALLCFLGSRTAAGQDPGSLTKQGDSLLHAGKHKQAIESYRAALAKGGHADALAGRASAYTATRRKDLALLDMEAALALDSLHVGANQQRAQYALALHQWEHAERLCSRALPAASDTLQRRSLLMLRGEARMEQNKNPLAIDDFRDGLALGTPDASALRHLAELCSEIGDHACAETELAKLTSLEPLVIDHYIARAYELNLLGQFSEALSASEGALQLDREEPTMLSNRAYALMQLGRTDEAMEDVQKSLKGDPVNPHALRTRALLYAAQGFTQKTCKDLLAAKAIGGVDGIDALLAKHCP